MKNLLLTTVLSASTLLAIAQNFNRQNFNRLALHVAVGNHFAMSPAQAKMDFLNLHAVNGGVRFMFTPYIGIMATGNYDFLDFKGLGSNNQNLIRTEVQGVVNVGNLCNFQQVSQDIGFLFHAGIGSSHLFSKETKRDDAKDPLFKNVDDMFNVMMGIRPQVRLNKHMTLFLDYTLVANFKQDFSYDFAERLSAKGIGGNMHSLKLGLSVSFGQFSEYADWQPYLGEKRM